MWKVVTGDISLSVFEDYLLELYSDERVADTFLPTPVVLLGKKVAWCFVPCMLGPDQGQGA